jgi:hypothetical protein
MKREPVDTYLEELEVTAFERLLFYTTTPNAITLALATNAVAAYRKYAGIPLAWRDWGWGVDGAGELYRYRLDRGNKFWKGRAG